MSYILLNHFVHDNFPLLVATISFSQEAYSVGESEQTLTVSVVRSGDTDSYVVVLITNHPYKGTATGRFLSAFPFGAAIDFLTCILSFMYPCPDCHSPTLSPSSDNYYNYLSYFYL